jgi:heme/copper-type cytochrome/quinol oxidase subunit 3
MASPMLALPAAGNTGSNVEARRATLPLATIVAGVAVVMVFAGLIGAYLALKAAPGAFLPKDVKFDNYTSSTLVITAVMASVMIEWAAYGIRKGFRGQSLFAFGITTMLGIAFLNALNYLIQKLPFGAGASPYATVVYAMLALAFAVALIGLFSVILTALRAAGHQLTTDNYQLARVAAFLWHVATISWLAVYYTIYITK